MFRALAIGCCALLVLSTAASGAEATVKRKARRKPRPAVTAPDATSATSSSAQLPAATTAGTTPEPIEVWPIRFSLSPGLASMEGVWGTAATLGVSYSVGIPLYIGFEAGVYNWATDGTISGALGSQPALLTTIPVLLTLLYRFPINSFIVPYIGVGAGAGVSFPKGGDTIVYFHGIVKPGFDLAVSRNLSLSLEPKLGVLKDQFIFLPNVSTTFYF